LPRGGSDNVVVFDRPLLEVAADLGLTHEAYYRAPARSPGCPWAGRRGWTRL